MKAKLKKAIERSAIMRAVRSTDTAPERAVGKCLRGIGISYRRHAARLPGKPDFVFASRRKAIFVHGCFWHGHTCHRGARIPKNNRTYWVGKIGRNRARDIATRRKLRAAGWRILTIWECQLKNERSVRDRISRFLADG